ncbi:MAG: glycosyltransferase family 2 protein [Bacteroidales bacterium]|nr:glycosyltransferase family 2 protein [Bacteroidales bacterium]
MNKPTISVIVPAYNAEKTLERSVASIMNQTLPFTEYEVILVNDGSQDGTARVCGELAKKYPFIYIIEKPNGGASSARNAGMKAARGEHIIFVDADDEVTPTYLETLLGEEDWDLHVGSMTLVNNKGERHDACLYERTLTTQEEMAEAVLEMMQKDLPVSVCNSLLKTSILRENNMTLDERMVQCEDADFIMRYLRFCKKVHLSDKPNYVYYLPDEKKTYNDKNGLRTSLKLLDNAYQLSMKESTRKAFRKYYLSWANEELFYYKGDEEELKALAEKFGELCQPYLKENDRKAFRHRMFKNMCRSRKAEHIIKTARRVMNLYHFLHAVSLRHLFRKA